MLKRSLAVAALLALVASPALARHCPKDMAEIDKVLAGMPMIDADKLAEVRKLRAEGEAQHKAGDHPSSEATLDKAKKILGIM